MPEVSLLIDTNGHRITSDQVQRSMRINIGAGCLGMIWFAMSVNMPLTMFMEAIGVSGVLIGLLTAVRQCAMAVQIPSAFISDHLGSRKRLWAWLALAHRSIWLLIAALAFYWKPGAWWVPVAVISMVGLSDLLGHASAAPWFSWLADLIPAKNGGRFWGRRQSMVTAASLVGMFIAGFALDQFRIPGTNQTSPFGFALVFGIAAICGISDAIVHLWVKEPRLTPAKIEAGMLQRLLAPVRDHDFRHLTLAMGIWSSGCSMLGPFGVIYLKRNFPVTYSHIAAVAIAASLGSVATSFIFGSLTDRLGARVLCAILMILAPITAIPWFLVNSSFLTFHLPWGGFWTIPQVVLVLVISSFIGGSIFSGVAPCQLRLAALLSNPSGRTVAMAVHWALIGLIAAFGSLAGGVIMDFINARPPICVLSSGTTFSYLHAIILVFILITWGLAVPLVLSIRTRVDNVAIGEAFSRMFLINPLNAVRNFYNLQIISAVSTARERAQATRSLGLHRSELAVPELIEQLEDPAMEVQEEAIEALGIIGSEAAIAALLNKLEDPSCDLIPQICRALRHCGDATCVEPLLRRLTSDDREILSECARALGRIGDRRAIPHLLNLITQSRDSKVLATSSEALAALGELSAAYQIIPQMRQLSNLMLKRALTIAAGDLLGKRGSIYQLLLADSESSGSGASQVIRDLSRGIKKEFPHATRQIETLVLLEAACHNAQAAQCAELLLHLGLHLAQFIHRLPLTLDPNEAMNRLLDRDRRSAIGVWYLKTLNEPWIHEGSDRRDLTDVLLGLHIVYGFTVPAEDHADLKSSSKRAVD